jgi:sugar phosphate isomerase/epimerase
MLIGGADPVRYFQKYQDMYWSFHLKDALADRSSDTALGRGTFDFKHFLAAVPELDRKPCYVEDENEADELAAARSNYEFLRGLEF